MSVLSMSVDWTQLFIQAPIVALFIWYSLELQKRYMQSMEKRDEAYLSALAKITAKLDKYDERLQEYQQKTLETSARKRP